MTPETGPTDFTTAVGAEASITPAEGATPDQPPAPKKPALVNERARIARGEVDDVVARLNETDPKDVIELVKLCIEAGAAGQIAYQIGAFPESNQVEVVKLCLEAGAAKWVANNIWNLHESNQVEVAKLCIEAGEVVTVAYRIGNLNENNQVEVAKLCIEAGEVVTVATQIETLGAHNRVEVAKLCIEAGAAEWVAGKLWSLHRNNQVEVAQQLIHWTIVNNRQGLDALVLILNQHFDRGTLASWVENADSANLRLLRPAAPPLTDESTLLRSAGIGEKTDPELLVRPVDHDQETTDDQGELTPKSPWWRFWRH